MNSFTDQFRLTLIILLSRLFGVNQGNLKLTAISDSHHVVQFYREIGNKNPPSHVDPALENANAKKRICEDITSSRFFYWKLLDPINLKNIYTELKQPIYSEIFHQMYTPPKNFLMKLLYDYEYTNAYIEKEFEIVSDYSADTIHIKEYVFVCLLRRGISERITPVYVSKEYNVVAGEPYIAGRFLFGVRGFHRHFMQLVEKPADILVNRKNGVELHYLRMRQQHQQGTNTAKIDPICNVVTTNLPYNQYHRLCVQVLTSSDFEGTIEYPRVFKSFDCYRKEVTFRTEDALRKAAGKQYHEFMVRCDSTIKDSVDEISFYVSRAYKPNQVFVYSNSEDARKVYLENLSINIGIVVESRFDDVE